MEFNKRIREKKYWVSNPDFLLSCQLLWQLHFKIISAYVRFQ